MKLLPMSIRQPYRLSWVPIYGLMPQAPGMNFDLSGNEIFKIGYDFLKTRIKYVFQNRKLKHDTWCVSYCSVKVCRSTIMKHGTEEDKSLLPQGTAINRKRKPKVQVVIDGRVVKRIRKPKINKNTNKATRLSVTNRTPEETVTNRTPEETAFNNAFGTVNEDYVQDELNMLVAEPTSPVFPQEERLDEAIEVVSVNT